MIRAMHIREINIFDTSRPLGTTIWTLVWPAILEQVLQLSVNYADSAMVGSLGAGATAAISINSSTIWLINGLMNALAIGFSVLMARNLGAGKKETASAIVRQGIVTQTLFGLFCTIVMLFLASPLPRLLGAEEGIWNTSSAYMRGIAVGYLPTMLMIGQSAMLRLSGDTKTPLLLNALDNAINIFLNLFFIFPHVGPFPGLGMGVEGAAIATSIAATITALLLFFSMQQKERAIRLEKGGSWKVEPSIQKKALLLSLPVALERSTLSLGQIFLTTMVSQLGITALAAHYLANTAEQFTFLPPSGFATAATTLVAQSLGAGKKDLAKKYADKCVISGVALMSAMGVLMYILAPSLLSFFTRDVAVIALGAAVLRIEAFAEPGFGLSQLVFGVMRGSGDTKAPFLISLVGMWVIRLPLAAILLHCTDLGLKAIWIAMMSDLTIRGVISFFVYRRGGWQTYGQA